MKIKHKYDEFDNNVVEKFANEIIEAFKKSNKEEIIIVNIGTDKCIGDSVAPMVGTFLTQNKSNFYTYGTLNIPMHALNLEKRLNIIKNEHPNAFVVAIDACLGDEEEVGQVIIKDAPIYPGRGVGKTLPQVGDLSVMLIVDHRNHSEIFTTRSIRLSFIYEAAETITKILMYVDEKVRDLNIENREVAIGF